MFVIIKRGRLLNMRFALIWFLFDDNKHIYIRLNVFVNILFYFSQIKYLLNKINITDFEFKRIFYSNKYLLQLRIVQFQASTITIQLWLQLHHISYLQFTSLHITHTHISIFNCIPVWIQHLSNLQKYSLTQ